MVFRAIDLQHGMQVEDLLIVNPFLQPAAVHEPAPRYGGGRRVRTAQLRSRLRAAGLLCAAEAPHVVHTHVLTTT